MTYEYVCTSCNHQWEADQSIKDAALKDCPKCKKATAKRQISGGTGFVLKGGGWYSDLYSSAGASSAKSKEAETGSGEKKSDAKGDAKSDGKTESAPKGAEASPSKGGSKDAKPAA